MSKHDRPARKNETRMAVRRGAQTPSRLSLRPLLVVIACVLTAVVAWQVLSVNRDNNLLAVVGAPTAASPGGRNTPVPRTKIGIVAGHNRVKALPDGDVARDPTAPFDPGAVCEDHSAIEADITLDIARRVSAELRRSDRLDVEVLGEFDARLKGYFGVALISLHVDACLKGFSGYKVARVTNSAVPAAEDRLVNCLREQYRAATNLVEHRDTITPDMKEYYAFREIAQTTPGAIIELGFLRDDHALLKQGELPAKGVIEGLRCFLSKP